jgi:hypothetical protein
MNVERGYLVCGQSNVNGIALVGSERFHSSDRFSVGELDGKIPVRWSVTTTGGQDQNNEGNYEC